MLKFPDNGSVATFLRDSWQKKPRFLPQALTELPALSAEEIAWLATQPDVESRLVFTNGEDGGLSYRVEHGPFADEYLAGLPSANWTLLVQDVDKHLPDLATLFGEFPFIPAWRIDDLMVSVAAPGGSVGPHIDNYDVFLCQARGSRNWQVAAAGSALHEVAHDELHLVEPFADFEEYTAVPGDVLYLPPGRGHWGVATDLCITYSVGMRAPTAGQLAGEFARAASESPGLDMFYQDDDLQAAESLGGEISAAALDRARQLVQAMQALDDVSFARLFGTMVTDPKAWLAPPILDDQKVMQCMESFAEGTALRLHGMTRLAWSTVDGSLLVFANGFSFRCDRDWREALLALSQTRRLEPSVFPALQTQPGGRALLSWLLEKGVFDGDHDKDA